MHLDGSSIYHASIGLGVVMSSSILEEVEAEAFAKRPLTRFLVSARALREAYMMGLQNLLRQRIH